MSTGIVPVLGMPGIRTAVTATPRRVFKGGYYADYLPQGRQISGTYSRDAGNTGDLDVLRAGNLMGKRTSGGLYAPSIIGLSTGAYTAGGTTLTVAAATGVELVRRIGASGTFKIVGPPSAAGTVAIETVTYSGISSTTVTITALANSYVSGSIIMPTDGSEQPLTIIPDGYGIKVTDGTGTSIDVPFPAMPVSGLIEAAQIINWPSDTSLRDWLRDSLSNSGGRFTLDYGY